MKKRKLIPIFLLVSLSLSHTLVFTGNTVYAISETDKIENTKKSKNDDTSDEESKEEGENSLTTTKVSESSTTTVTSSEETSASAEKPVTEPVGTKTNDTEVVSTNIQETDESKITSDENVKKEDKQDDVTKSSSSETPPKSDTEAKVSDASKETSKPQTNPTIQDAKKTNGLVTENKVFNPVTEVPIASDTTSSTPVIGQFRNVGLTGSIIIGNKYVEHWSGDDAYTHDLLSKRFGISAEQLDGFLDSTGIDYDSNRFNGENLLKWEKESGLDVRAIVAIAIAESSLGTAGVAKNNQANAFGYSAFDNNPDNAKRYSDEVAIKALTKISIIQNKNNSFKRQDEKARQLASGQLDVAKDGGVYFTDTSGTGKKRAKVMEDLDKWIDQHGGTPKAPALETTLVSSGSIASSIPEGFSLSSSIDQSGYTAASYPWGQCTWYVYNRAKELGISFSPFMGNGGDWRFKYGFETTHEPVKGAAISFAPGQAGADGTYGHVAFVEDVREDGSVLISESNVTGLGNISFRTFSSQDAKQLTYVLGQR